MRRIVLSLAVAAAAVLAACSGGGQVLSTGGNSSADHVIVSTGGQTNIARVLAGSAIALSAQSVRGSNNGVLGKNTFVWSAAIVNGGTYPINALGAQKPCAAISIGASPAGPFSPYTPDYSLYIAIDPVNEANIVFEPPLTIPVPAGSFVPVPSAASAYCVVVSATQGGTTGSTIVAVVNPQVPQQ